MTPRAWKRLFSRIILWTGVLLSLALLAILANSTWHVYTKEQEARQEHIDASDELSDLDARQASLTAKIASLDTERGVEAEVRDRYSVAKSGEEIIVLTNNANAPATTTPSESKSLWQTVIGWLGW